MDRGFLPYILLWLAILATPSIVAWLINHWRTCSKEYPLPEPEHYWVHWRYEPNYWHEFAQKEWADARRDTLRLLALAGVSLPLLLIILTVVGVWLNYNFTGAILLALSVVSVFLILASLTYFSGRDLYQRRLNRPGEVFIGKDGIICSDGQDFVFRIKKARYMFAVSLEEADFQVLCFVSQYSLPRNMGQRGNPNRLGHARVLVPLHAIDEARHIMHQSEHYVEQIYRHKD